jgi:hypothetical protein
MRMTTQICIVSERLMPNLIPALMLRPERVLLLSSVEMDELGMRARLQDLLSSCGFSVVVRGGLPSGGLSLIRAYATAMVDELQPLSRLGDVVLNLTGGNKLMAIAFSEVLGPVVQRMIYTDTAHGLLEELPRSGQGEGISRALEGVVNVALYLRAQGMRPRVSRSDEAAWVDAVLRRRALTKNLGRQAGSLGDFFGAVNALASQALDEHGDSVVEPRQYFRQAPWGHWAATLRQIEAAGLVRWDGRTGLEFSDTDATRYLNGGWLEEYAWLAARELHPDDLRLGVEGDWEQTRRGRNELDVVVVHSNRLLLIECKTLRMGRDSQSDTDLLYKLDSVGDDVRGLFGEVVLLSAREPSALIEDRAGHHRIQVVGPARLGDLQRDIRDWMERGQFPGR